MASACSRESTSQGRKSYDGASVLIITLDTTRADHLGCYGRAAAKTPTLDALAKEGIRFRDAATQAPLTLVAHASLLTGAYPKQHGIHDNGRFSLAAGIPTLGEIFGSHGYDTAAFVGSVVLAKKFGLDRGFGVYDDDVGAYSQQAATTEAQRGADKVTDSFIKWLSSHGNKPFFSWVHFYDPHKPYAPPAGSIPPGGTPYDGEIAFCDGQINRMLAALKDKGLRDRTLVIVTADHGESFGEHREEDHVMFLYDTNLAIPMIFNMPGLIQGGRTVDTLVRISDIAPTLMSLFGWTAPETMKGENLADALTGKPLQPGFSIAESYTAFYQFNWAIQRSITTADWKYVDSTVPELFSRRNDPGERNNLHASQADTAARLRQQLHDFEDSLKEHAAAAVALDSAEQRQLRSLGYLGGDAGTSSQTQTAERLPDPKEMYDVVLESKRAHSFFSKQQFQQAIQVAEPVYRRCPQSSELQYVLGCSYAMTRQWEPARQCLEAFVKNNPTSVPALTTLGTALRSLGKLNESIQVLEAAVRIDSSYTEGRLMLGVSLVHANRAQEGLAHVEAVVQQQPNNPRARQILESLRTRVQKQGGG